MGNVGVPCHYTQGAMTCAISREERRSGKGAVVGRTHAIEKRTRNRVWQGDVGEV